jgi:chromosomal replication initiator protein
MTTVATIISAVAHEFGISELDVRSPRRDVSIVRARHVAMYVARHATACSFPTIANAFGDRDHTTVMYGVRRITKELPGNPDLTVQVRKLLESFGQEMPRCA